MGDSSDQEDLAILLQETLEELKSSRQQNAELLHQYQGLVDQLKETLDTRQLASDKRRKQTPSVKVTLQTRVSAEYMYAKVISAIPLLQPFWRMHVRAALYRDCARHLRIVCTLCTAN